MDQNKCQRTTFKEDMGQNVNFRIIGDVAAPKPVSLGGFLLPNSVCTNTPSQTGKKQGAVL